MVRTIIACCLVLLLLASVGCSLADRPSAPGAASAPPEPPKTSPPLDPPTQKPLQNPDEYKDKIPQAKVPDNVTNLGQRIIAVFNHGSNICVINGRETVMEGKAIIKKYRVLIPFKTLATIVAIPEDAEPFDPDGKTGLIEDKSIVYMSPESWIIDIGYDFLKDHHIGRFEILESFPLSKDDLTIGDISLTMTFGEIRRMLGPPRLECPLDLYYHDLSVYSMAINKSPYRITVRSDRFATSRGIRVGDRLDKVFELYGRGYCRGLGYAQPDVFSYGFPPSIGKIELAFEVDENNRVKEIVLNNFGEAGMYYSVTR